MPGCEPSRPDCGEVELSCSCNSAGSAPIGCRSRSVTGNTRASDYRCGRAPIECQRLSYLHRSKARRGDSGCVLRARHGVVVVWVSLHLASRVGAQRRRAPVNLAWSRNRVPARPAMNHSLLRSQVVTSRSDSTIDESNHLRRRSIALIDKSRALLVDSRECLLLSNRRLARSARLLRVT